MKGWLINNLGLKVLSIFLAFFVWLVVMNVANPERTRSREIPLEIENEQILTAARKTYELVGKSTVTIAYGVRSRDEYKVSTSDFRAYIDLAELYDVTGSVQVKVEVLNNKEIISNATAKTATVRIDIEDLQRKRFDILVVQSGEPEDGYAVNEIKLSPSYVYVSGPVSLIGQISYVGVELDVGELDSDMEDTASIVYFDANDNELSLGERVTLNTPEANYSITMHRVKNVNLDFVTAGTVALGYQYAGVESNIKSVAVQGPKTTLASLNKITIPGTVLNIDGAAGDRKVTVNLLEYLPEGVSVIGSDGIVEVLLKVERMETRKFTLDNQSITLSGVDDNYQYVLNPAQVELTVQGLGEDLDNLLLADFEAVLDVSQFEPGNTYQGDLLFRNSEVYKIISFTDFEVITARKGENIEIEPTAEMTNSEMSEQVDSEVSNDSPISGSTETSGIS